MTITCSTNHDDNSDMHDVACVLCLFVFFFLLIGSAILFDWNTVHMAMLCLFAGSFSKSGQNLSVDWSDNASDSG